MTLDEAALTGPGRMGRPATPSIRRNSSARLAANAVRIIAGFGAATITARVLGPADKGTLSTLLYLVVLVGYASTLGLGDAVIILTGSGRVPRRDAVSASLLPLALVSMLGAASIWGVASLAEWSNILPAVALGSAAVVIAAFTSFFLDVHTSMERLVFSSGANLLQIALDLLALVLLVYVLRMGIWGGAMANVIGLSSAFLVLVWSIRSKGLLSGSYINVGYVKQALKLGVILETSYLLTLMAQRLDLVLVYSLADEAAAGRYSVALTVGQISSYAAASLVIATFPRLAKVSRDKALVLTQRAFRLCVAMTAASSAALCILVPWGIPLAFGEGFTAAVPPTIILLAGGVVWSAQWCLSQAAAARERSRVPLFSYGMTVVVMLGLDVFLIPWAGAAGAAVGSVLGNAAGLAVVLRWYGHESKGDLRALVPGPADFAELLRFGISVVRRVVPSR